MNFVLIHCLGKLILRYGSFAVHILSLQVHQQEKDCTCASISDKNQDSTDIMEQMEKKQFEAGHNGLSQRRSYPNIVDHSTNNQLQSTAMSRQDSKSSILSGTTVSSSQQSGSSTPSAGDQASHRPKNFGTVVGGIYRSSYPQEADYPFLTKLGLKTIM